MSDNFFYILLLKPNRVDDIIDFSRQNHHFFLIIDMDSIVSEMQVMVAIDRARRRMENSSRVRELGPLVLMYISGEPQVGKAIRAAGISARTKKAMIVCDNAEEMKKFLDQFGDAIEQIMQPPIPHDEPLRDREVFFAMSNVDFQS
jgi:tRNA threonylcarbamoyladenosine modification (KEOPS) complex Cgi121 subunit